MSDHIPFEIQSEIMRMLPVKSLIQFRSVCKAWKSLIHSSDFIAHYTSQQQHLLIRYEDAVDSEVAYSSIVDDDNDDSFPQQQQVAVTIPPLVGDMPKKCYITTDGYHGLLCLFSYNKQNAVIWNPFITKSVAVTVPNKEEDERYRTVLGFWVCRETKDPKIVKISIDLKNENPWLVEVFTLSTNTWRGSYTTNLPRRPIHVFWDQVVVDGCLYRLAGDGDRYLIISFDITSEEFGEVNLPHSFVYPHLCLSMHKLRESLVVIEDCQEDYKRAYRVWMMEDGVSKSFKKLYTISGLSLVVSMFYVRGFRKTGEPLIELESNRGSTRMLAAYEPNSKSLSNIDINGRFSGVYSCMETLILL